MVQTLTRPKNILENEILRKGLNQIGLKLSESEVNQLNMGETVFLKNIELGQIGSVFIMASAFLNNNQDNIETSINVKSLSENTNDCFPTSGITLYNWNYGIIDEKPCLYFTLINGIPALKICCRIRAIS